MKKTTLLFVVFCLFGIGYAQCLTAPNGQWPGATFVPNSGNCDGILVQTITTAGYAGEYSKVTVVSGQTYTFSSSIATDIVTISVDNGATAATFGTGSVTWVATISGDIRFYTHLAACGDNTNFRDRRLVCGIPSTDTPDYVNIQFPATTSTPLGGPDVTIYAQVYEAGLTDVAPNITGQAPGITAWIGYSTTNTNPNTWTNWVPATWNAGHVSNNDEYQIGLGATLPAGTYYYASRFRLNNGPAVYGGVNNIWNATTAPSGVLTVVSPVTNDLFANAIAVTCGNVYTGNTTQAALDEDNAPDGFGADMDARNVWYKFTGTGAAQTVTLNLCGSAYDTSVLVYTGTSGNLTLIAANDDDNTCVSNTLNSKVNFTSDGTTTYYIAIEGYDPGSYGAYTMNVTCTAVNPPAVANQDCGTSLLVAVNGIDVNSDNSYGTVSSTQPTCDTFGSIQDVWFRFVAPASGLTDCLVTNGTMTSANFNIYSGTCAALTALPGTCNSNLTAATTESLTGLIAGETYYVQVWSNSSEQGTFTLRLTDPGLGTSIFENADFIVYPNPVKEVLNLSYVQIIDKIQVLNLIGQEVIAQNITSTEGSVDFSNLTAGVYLVKITSNGKVKTVRVIKE